MSRFFVILALAAACGRAPPAVPEDVHPNSPANQPTDAPPCTAGVEAVAPLPDGVPVARASTIRVQMDGPVDRDAKIVAIDEDGVVGGELLIGVDSVELVPHRPFAQGDVSWEAIVCDAHVAGRFEAGALLRPVGVDALHGFVGRSYGFDLRGADWQAPVAKDGLDLVLRSLFGGALVVRVDGAAPDRMTVVVGSGVVDQQTGAVVLAEGGTRFSTTVPLKDDPYVVVSLPTLELPVDGRTLRVAGATLVLGMTEDAAFDDVRLAGEVDVRDFGDLSGRTGCDLLAAYSDGRCAPCASDGEAACFALALGALRAD